MDRFTPEHYAGKIQVIDLITQDGMDFMQGNVLKYVTRFKRKHGKQDLQKALDYLLLMISRYDELYGEPDARASL